MGCFAFSLFLAFTLFPFPTPASPVTPSVLDARKISSTRTGGGLAFDIAFSLGLLITILGTFAWIATGGTITQLIEGISALSVAVSERLSRFRLSSLIEQVAATIVDAADADVSSTPRRGGASFPTATVPWYRFQVEGIGGTQGSGNPSTLASFT